MSFPHRHIHDRPPQDVEPPQAKESQKIEMLDRDTIQEMIDGGEEFKNYSLAEAHGAEWDVITTLLAGLFEALGMPHIDAKHTDDLAQNGVVPSESLFTLPTKDGVCPITVRWSDAGIWSIERTTE